MVCVHGLNVRGEEPKTRQHVNDVVVMGLAHGVIVAFEKGGKGGGEGPAHTFFMNEGQCIHELREVPVRALLTVTLTMGSPASVGRFECVFKHMGTPTNRSLHHSTGILLKAIRAPLLLLRPDFFAPLPVLRDTVCPVHGLLSGVESLSAACVKAVDSLLALSAC